MLGYSLARSAASVFVEKGTRLCRTRERFAPRYRKANREPTVRSGLLRRLEPAGRSTDEIEDISGRSRSGSCRSSQRHRGSSACTAWSANGFRARFHSRQDFRDPGDSTVPEAWPISYDQMHPGTPRSKNCSGPRPTDPLRPEAADVGLPAAPPFRQTTSRWLTSVRSRTASYRCDGCDYTEGCGICQDYLCAKSCKNDAGRNCVLPAVASTRPAGPIRVVHLEADRTQVQRVICIIVPARWPEGQGGGARRGA